MNLNFLNRFFLIKKRCFSPSTTSQNQQQSSFTGCHPPQSPSPAALSHPPSVPSPGLLNNNYFSQSPSPTRKLFVTRRSMSPVPCTLRPSTLGVVANSNNNGVNNNHFTASGTPPPAAPSPMSASSNKRKCIKRSLLNIRILSLTLALF